MTCTTPLSRRNPTEFYKCLHIDEHGQLNSYAYWTSVFGSKHLYEETFSKIKYVRSHNWVLWMESVKKGSLSASHPAREARHSLMGSRFPSGNQGWQGLSWRWAGLPRGKGAVGKYKLFFYPFQCTPSDCCFPPTACSTALLASWSSKKSSFIRAWL